MAYLMIQNPGVAPPEAFLVSGLSMTRDESGLNESLIGQFGTGNKMGTLVCMRHQLRPVIFAGKLRMEFTSEGRVMKDDIKAKDYKAVHAMLSGRLPNGKTCNRKHDMNMSIDAGAVDWTDPRMGIREFISNSIDYTNRLYAAGKLPNLKCGDEFTPAVYAIQQGLLQVEAVMDNQVRAKDGFTRVFVPLQGVAETFESELHKWFLHWTEPELLNKIVLPKHGRNFSDHRPAMIYRRGVLIREIGSSQQSLFDYNLSNLKVDEARNCDDNAARWAAMVGMRYADVDTITTVISHSLNFGADKRWEDGFDADYLSGRWVTESEEKRNERNAILTEAWKRATGDKIIVVNRGDDDKFAKHQQESLERKGHEVVEAPEKAKHWEEVAKAVGAKTANDFMTADDLAGRQITPETEDARWALDTVVGWMKERAEALDLGEIVLPELETFVQVMSHESQTWAYHIGSRMSGRVGIHRDIATGRSRFLIKAMIEELVHHVTGATDNSRDFQDFVIRWVADLLIEGHPEVAQQVGGSYNEPAEKQFAA